MSETQTLVQKLAEACDQVGGIEKKGKNLAQNYNYVKAADVAKALRHELFSRGVLVLPDETKIEWIDIELAPKQGQDRGSRMTECRLEVTFNLTDGVSTLPLRGWGVARDSGDKAIYKAKTGALKYFLRGLGLIPDEKDDPEADESVDRAQRASKRQQAPNKHFTGVIKEITPTKTGVTALKLGEETLAVDDLALDSMLAGHEGEEAEVECEQCFGTGGKLYWKVINVITVGKYDYSESQVKTAAKKVDLGLTPELEKSVKHVNLMKKIFAVAGAKRIPEVDVKKVAYETYKVDSMTKLSEVQLQGVLSWVESVEG